MTFHTNFNAQLVKHGTVVVLCLLLTACFRKKSNADLPQIGSFIVDSIYLPISEGNHQQLKIKEVKEYNNSRELIAFVKELNFKLYTYDLKHNCYVDSIDISGFRGEYVDFAPMNADSFLITNRDNKIFLVTKNTYKEWIVSFITQKLGSSAFISYLSAEPLHVFGDTVMVTTSTSEYFPYETGPNIPFLKANHDVVFRLLKDSVALIAMHNPIPAYFYQQDYYSRPERAFINSSKIVYTYRHSDTISIYDFNTQIEKRKQFETNNFEKNKPFDYSQMGDFKYIMEYAYTQSRNGTGDLSYDRFRHLIYQRLRHKGQYVDSVTGQKNQTEDIPSSIFVFDENLNQQKEVYVPGKTLSYSQFSFISKSGFYYAKAFSKQKYHDKMLFYRIVFK